MYIFIGISRFIAHFPYSPPLKLWIHDRVLNVIRFPRSLAGVLWQNNDDQHLARLRNGHYNIVVSEVSEYARIALKSDRATDFYFF